MYKESLTQLIHYTITKILQNYNTAFRNKMKIHAVFLFDGVVNSYRPKR